MLESLLVGCDRICVDGVISFLCQLIDLFLELIDFFLGVSHVDVTFLVDFLESFDALFDGNLGLYLDEGLDFLFFTVVLGFLGF